MCKVGDEVQIVFVKLVGVFDLCFDCVSGFLIVLCGYVCYDGGQCGVGVVGVVLCFGGGVYVGWFVMYDDGGRWVV